MRTVCRGRRRSHSMNLRSPGAVRPCTHDRHARVCPLVVSGGSVLYLGESRASNYGVISEIFRGVLEGTTNREKKRGRERETRSARYGAHGAILKRGSLQPGSNNKCSFMYNSPNRSWICSARHISAAFTASKRRPYKALQPARSNQ